MFNQAKQNNELIIIAGPCSAESREQLQEVATALQGCPQMTLVRCGAWKPRTHPGGFEGVGEEALRWISSIKREHPNMRFAVEVAQPDHVEKALRYGIDALWIGARTAGNPFAMSELGRALSGSDLPIMVKNPPVPDVNLWMGAIERLQAVGISDIAAVHRGFVTPHAAPYRHEPLWQIPVELRRACPTLPLLCDPSHIAGQAQLVPSIAQTALNLGFEGLMVEVHPHPEQALTDACQQLTPENFLTMLSQLTRRTQPVPNSEEMQLLREHIRLTDSQLLHLLADRFDTARHIATLKQRSKSSLYQPEQWQTKLSQCIAEARELGLDESFVKNLYEMIHMESIRVQEAQLDTPTHSAQ